MRSWFRENFWFILALWYDATRDLSYSVQDIPEVLPSDDEYLFGADGIPHHSNFDTQDFNLDDSYDCDLDFHEFHDLHGHSHGEYSDGTDWSQDDYYHEHHTYSDGSEWDSDAHHDYSDFDFDMDDFH